MGHSTQTEIVTAKELADYEKANPHINNRSRYDLETTGDRIISLIVEKWYDEPNLDSSNVNIGNIDFKPTSPEEVLSWKGLLDEVHSDRTIIIPLMDNRDYIMREATINVKLDRAEWEQFLKRDRDVLVRKVAESRPDIVNSIASINVVFPDGKEAHWTVATEWKVLSTIETDTSGGKTKNVYYVSYAGGRVSNFYDTQALAHEAGLVFMKENRHASKIRIEATVKREDGNYLATMTREVKSATAKLKVKYAKVKTDSPRTKSWIVAFDYSY